MGVIVPVIPGDPEQIIEIVLDEELFVLRLRWNTSDNDGAGSWYLDAWESDGVTPIAFSIKLVIGVRLGETYNHPLFQSGMFLVDESGTGAEAGLFDLGGRVQLYHLTVGDAVLAETTAL